jgi:FtsP/CotA-like multicopper oxidase with cupredoxin domain
MPLDRRRFLEMAGVGALAASLPRHVLAGELAASEPADYTIRVATGLVELAPDHIVSSTLYNGQFPGPLIRFKEGQRTIVDIYNDTDVPELVHWHGQMIPSNVDGAAEEGSPYVPPRGMRRIDFIPKPAGFRFYHTHVVPRADLSQGTYTGQAGVAYIEPKNEPGAYDQEIFLVMKEFEPSFSRGGDMDIDMLAPGEPLKELKETGAKADEEAKGTPKGYEVAYELFSINGKMLGVGEPIRVKEGERLLFHVLNASATEIRSLALPGHVFRVVALDGNPVPTPAEVPVLWLGTAERISAIVEMNHPGVFVMGDLSDDDRPHGMGIVVEYSGRKGEPQWAKPKPFRWDYTRFGKADAAATPPDETSRC